MPRAHLLTYLNKLTSLRKLRVTCLPQKPFHRLVGFPGFYNGQDSVGTVVEYNTVTKSWDGSRLWPQLPIAAHGNVAVVTGTHVHLFSGFVIERGRNTYMAHNVMMSLVIVDQAPFGRWFQVVGNEEPPRELCAAGLVHGQIMIAGGRKSGLSMNHEASCDILSTTGRWLRLPSMATARSAVQLVTFHGNILAIGGVHSVPSTWSMAIEAWNVHGV